MDAWIWLVWLAIGVVAAIVCARIATSKGRSAIGYGILGFVLPLIGLIVVAVLPSRQGQAQA